MKAILFDRLVYTKHIIYLPVISIILDIQNKRTHG
jgi:hypothetical protein